MTIPTLMALLDARAVRPFWGRAWVEAAFASHLPGFAAGSELRVGGWSVGSCVDSQTLVQSRPIARRGDDPVRDLLRAAAPCTLGVFHSTPREGDPASVIPRTARFRRWMGAAVGPILREESRAVVLDALPPFLRRDGQGQPDVQLLLLRALASLFDASGFRQAYAEPQEIACALATVAEAFPNGGPRALLIGDGKTVGVLHRGGCLLALHPPRELRPSRMHAPADDSFVPASLLVWTPEPRATQPSPAERISPGIYTLQTSSPGRLNKGAL